jgi:hypothetical protein
VELLWPRDDKFVSQWGPGTVHLEPELVKQMAEVNPEAIDAGILERLKAQGDPLPSPFAETSGFLPPGRGRKNDETRAKHATRRKELLAMRQEEAKTN